MNINTQERLIAAKDHATALKSGGIRDPKFSFLEGANWQKEKDKVIIDKLIDLLSEFIKMQNDPTYGDLVWRLLIKEQSELLLNSLK